MKILALDISSTACGWAVLTGWPPKVLDFGVIKPRGKTSVERIRKIAREVDALLTHESRDGVEAIVAEWSSGKIHGRIQGRVPHGQAVLGQAQGYVVGWLEQFEVVELVGENEWTRGGKKAARANRLELTCPEYRNRKIKDPGFDAADAIGLGVWWLERQRTEQLMRGSA